MKILQVTNLGFEHGGVETGIVLLREELLRRGHEVKIFTSNARPDLPHFSDVEFEALEHLPKILQVLYRSFYPAPYIALKKVLKEFAPDIVHLHTISQISPSILFLLKRYPTVLTVHQTEDYTISILPWSFPVHFFRGGTYRKEDLTFVGRLHFLYHQYISKTVYRFGFRNIDKVVALSRYMQTCLREDGIESIYMPNTTKLFDPAPLVVSAQRIVYVGRLEQTKGVQTIISAMPLILSRFPNTKFCIVGRGEYQTELEAFAARLQVNEQVEFVGFQNRKQLYERYAHATVVVMPSIWPESFGKVGIEAMSVGRPVIATNIGGTGDWLEDGVNGFFINPNDADGLAQKVLKLFSDTALLEQCSSNALLTAQRFNIHHHVDVLIDLFETLKL